MQSQEKDNLIIARFFPNENVFEQLKNLCLKHNIKTGVVLSGIGQLGFVELGFFKEKGNYTPQKFESPLEVLNISGIISANEKSLPLHHNEVWRGGEYDFHLHINLSNEQKNTLGGHFIGGIVSVTLEIAILKTDIAIKRDIEEKTGLRGLFF
ncbi:MAG: DNA-binding protein [Candidatus Pacebacteria bacterium]|nr:DNA-binding protein [Candidatus Paceibacterota bacterium]